MFAPASEEIVKARDKAILAALKYRPRSAYALLREMPNEPAQTDAQRIVARDSALIRLGVKKLIRQTSEGWVLA